MKQTLTVTIVDNRPEPPRNNMKKWIALAIVAVIAVPFIIFFAAQFFSQGTANLRGETAKRNLVEANGNYRIEAYDHFYDLCAKVQTDKNMLANTEASLKGASSLQKQELASAILAQRNQLAADVNQYNVDAHKGYTLGQFKASDLPWQLSMKGHTTCR